MALNPSAFGIGATAEEQSSQPQQPQPQKRRKSGLAALMAANDTSAPADDLSKAPIGEGELSSPIATPSIENAPGAPSLLATERVDRAPSTYSASPLLGGQQRAQAALGEADRGEEGSIGGLSTGARNRALMSFFKPRSSSPQQTAQAEEAGPSDAALAKGSFGAAKSLYNTGKQLNRTPEMDYSDVPGFDPRLFDGTNVDDITTFEGVDVPRPGQVPATGAPQSMLNLKNASAGLGTLGSLLGLAGTATGNKNLALAGQSASLAGQGAGFANAPSLSGGAGLAGAGLGLAGSLTGNKGLSYAGQGVSTLQSALALYNAINAITASGGAAGAAGAAATGAAAAGGTGAALGAVAAPLAFAGLMAWLGPLLDAPSDYDMKHDIRPNVIGQNQLATMHKLTDFVTKNPDALHAALTYDMGDGRSPLRTLYDGRAWSDMNADEYASVIDQIRQDPSLLSKITGDASQVPYMEQRNMGFYGQEAGDYTRNMIAKALGVPYGFVPREYRPAMGAAPGLMPDNDLRLQDLWEQDGAGTPTGNLNPRKDWQSVIDAMQTAQQRGVNISGYGMPTLEDAQRMLAQQRQPAPAPSLQDLYGWSI